MCPETSQIPVYIVLLHWLQINRGHNVSLNLGYNFHITLIAKILPDIQQGVSFSPSQRRFTLEPWDNWKDVKPGIQTHECLPPCQKIKILAEPNTWHIIPCIKCRPSLLKPLGMDHRVEPNPQTQHASSQPFGHIATQICSPCFHVLISAIRKASSAIIY